MFSDELTLQFVCWKTNANIGVLYEMRTGDLVRRLLLRRSEYHVYYAVTDNEVSILVVWGARREHSPKL